MSTRTPSDEGFLSRWSRRKREGEPEEHSAPLPATPVTEAEAPVGAEAIEPEAETVEPPSLDLIDKDFDLATWLKQNVPETWKLAAMRRAWENDPAIANFENPARDYALDWNTPGGAPGYGPLTESDDVAEMVRGIFGEAPTPAEAALVEEEAGSDGVPHLLSSKDDEGEAHAAVPKDGREEGEPAALRLTEDGEKTGADDAASKMPPLSAYAAAQQEAPQEAAAPRLRKRGGGAIPI
ncbi:MAG: DUF3306 domain-containing protein [Bosea sp. (in: a-proteobacteria)]|uniref:DUF3306 domain-containing protein n=1 Tax=Bosea sp. (in: a-proteobacteria) TaxID=1871050 RepID=UPI0027347BEA|nr:DUF3306 domain-containing protein [Bosea sp. (in: a-proteobacteria)]MDP3256477.1 DUF3306 domain-containing protein [Bosea sp. (in: a-proteobacteria)]MDP3319880.1 DUF3306 domain-containing protein [Bosea sp. (in: a-proteobacteria)]